MGGENNGGLFTVIADNGIQDIVPGCWIHTANGLIQKIEVGLPAHNQNELDLFLGSLGHGLESVIGIDAQSLEHVIGLLLIEVFIEIIKELNDLVDAHPIIQIGSFGQIGNYLLGFHPWLFPVNEDFPTGGCQKLVSQLNKSALTASVGAQQPDNAAAFHGEIDIP